jgi:hypothetical protein
MTLRAKRRRCSRQFDLDAAQRTPIGADIATAYDLRRLGLLELIIRETLATSRTEACGRTVITVVTMMSLALIGF